MWNNDKAFTLIEVVIAMLLMTIILGGAYALLFSGMNSWTHGEDQIDVVQNMRVAMDKMSGEIRDATAITSAGTSYVEFSLPKYDLTGEDTIRYQYDRIDKEIERKKGSDSPQPVASRIKRLIFSYSGDPVKMVTITMVGAKSNGQEITMKTSVLLRAVSH